MKVLPTPTGPMMKALRACSTKRSETSSDQMAAVIGDLGALVPGLEHHVRVQLGRPGP